MNDTIPALSPLIEPASIPFTIDTWGWYIVSGIFFIFLLFIALLLIHYHRKNRYRHKALQWLKAEEKRLSDSKAYPELVYAANMLAKQISMQRYGREKVADLRDNEWIDFLNRTCKPELFDKQDEHTLAALYDPELLLNEKSTTLFVSKIKSWIKNHKYVLRDNP